MNTEEPRRFWSKVDVGEPEECWEWLASKPNSYGRFSIHRKPWKAHRVAWILTYGPIPEGLLCCHHCDNPGCCNPYHLFLGTNTDNMLDAIYKRRRGKLLPEDVLEIRDSYADGELTIRELAAKYGVRSRAIRKLLSGRIWSWL